MRRQGGNTWFNRRTGLLSAGTAALGTGAILARKAFNAWRNPPKLQRQLLPAALNSGTRSGGTELKSVDQPGGQVSIFTAGFIGPVVQPPVEGSSFYHRIGRRTRGVSLEIKGIVSPTLDVNATAPVNAQLARIIILYDRQANGANPAIADVLNAYNNAGATSGGTPYDSLNMNNRDRFIILRDRFMYLPPLATLGGTPAKIQGVTVDPYANKSLIYHEFIKLKGLQTHYKASTGGIGDIATGSFLILTISNGDNNTVGQWALNYGARFKFFD